MTGVTSADVFQNMMTYGMFTGALVTHYGAEKIGCLIIPAGPGYQPGSSAGRCRASTCSWVSRSAASRASPFRQKMIGGLSAPL